jgi:hypothetical protein
MLKLSTRFKYTLHVLQRELHEYKRLIVILTGKRAGIPVLLNAWKAGIFVKSRIFLAV